MPDLVLVAQKSAGAYRVQARGSGRITKRVLPTLCLSEAEDLVISPGIEYSQETAVLSGERAHSFLRTRESWDTIVRGWLSSRDASFCLRKPDAPNARM